MKIDMNTKIIEVTAGNLQEHPQVICFINPKHQYYPLKIEWLQDRFREGLRIKLLYIEEEKRPVGFIEYVPGEKCWRAVSAEGYTFIHCLWTNGKKFQHQGLGAQLLAEVEKDSKGTAGIAVLTSDASFMAGRELFLKNGYNLVQEDGKEQLLVKKNTGSGLEERAEDEKRAEQGLPEAAGAPPVPSINDWRSELARYTGLFMVYSMQCPWVARFIEEVKPVLAEYKLNPEIIQLKKAEEAQRAPSLYGVFSLIRDGRLLADRYISTTRFRNILKKEYGR